MHPLHAYLSTNSLSSHVKITCIYAIVCIPKTLTIPSEKKEKQKYKPKSKQWRVWPRVMQADLTRGTAAKVSWGTVWVERSLLLWLSWLDFIYALKQPHQKKGALTAKKVGERKQRESSLCIYKYICISPSMDLSEPSLSHWDADIFKMFSSASQTNVTAIAKFHLTGEKMCALCIIHLHSEEQSWCNYAWIATGVGMA